MSLTLLIPTLTALAAAGILAGLAAKKQMEKKARLKPIPVRVERNR